MWRGLCALLGRRRKRRLKNKLVSAALVPAITIATLLSIVDARATIFEIDGTTTPMFILTNGGGFSVGSITMSGTFNLGAILASPSLTTHVDLTLALPRPPPTSDWGSGQITFAGIGFGSTVGSWPLIDIGGTTDHMSLTFAGDLVGYAGGPFTGTWSDLLETCIDNDCEETNIRFSVSGTATAIGTTPIPAALPLFASGLGALGLFGWRRKRKARMLDVRAGHGDTSTTPRNN
jgi:hypothetical protein